MKPTTCGQGPVSARSRSTPCCRGPRRRRPKTWRHGGTSSTRLPKATGPGTSSTAAGYDYQAAAENLAVGLAADDVLIGAWMASPGHRHNILNKRYTDIGIGIARGLYRGQETVYVVQLFGTPRRVSARPGAQ